MALMIHVLAHACTCTCTGGITNRVALVKPYRCTVLPISVFFVYLIVVNFPLIGKLFTMFAVMWVWCETLPFSYTESVGVTDYSIVSGNKIPVNRIILISLFPLSCDYSIIFFVVVECRLSWAKKFCCVAKCSYTSLA